MTSEGIEKTFENLIKDVHEKGLCGECGGCVSFCSAGDIKAIEMSEAGPPKYIDKERCLECGICYFVCPQTHVLDDQLNTRFNFKYLFSACNFFKYSSLDTLERLFNNMDPDYRNKSGTHNS